MNQLAGAFLAFCAAVGIHYNITGHLVTIAFDYVVVAHGIWHWIQQLALQHFVYHLALKPRDKIATVGTTGTITGK